MQVYSRVPVPVAVVTRNGIEIADEFTATSQSRSFSFRSLLVFVRISPLRKCLVQTSLRELDDFRSAGELKLDERGKDGSYSLIYLNSMRFSECCAENRRQSNYIRHGNAERSRAMGTLRLKLLCVELCSLGSLGEILWGKMRLFC